MNAKQANSILLTDIMARLGYKVYQTHKGGTELAYLSPFRREAKASFYINTRKNAWFDHGEAQGAYSVVDFAVEYLKSSGKAHGVSDALDWLESLGLHQGTPIPTRDIFKPEEEINLGREQDLRELEFIRASPITHPAITQYLKGRGISEAIAKHHLLEIQYRNLKFDKVYFGFGMENISGGYEVRSAMDTPAFKSALIERNITFISGSKQDTHDINIFEGMTDYLSLLQLYNCLELSNDTIIMHSISSFQNTCQFLREYNHDNINLWLDNDKSGRKAVNRFIEAFPGKIQDQSFRYASFNDLNDILKESRNHKGQWFQNAFLY